ncbi:leucine rich repeat (LRR) protein [Prosthecobacter fusiformis]|uniref:Leucine rich repeat (LRR) protein n=1 Tax=Prosthecobacter fusiformis TaxID=48464 RepID=A0A4R7RND6_9BACT|nr:G protein-coupled receptor LGR4 [Prosthecobacter fusiformis]TDU64544.1 leucine rich repeat (LRR) protein [Prosthecobacter fusiformis]
MRPVITLFTILAFSVPAFALDPHVEAVIRTVEAAKGKVVKTEDGQSLKLVDLSVPNAGPHDHRKEDPYDAAFFEHLGHITPLESLNVISTKFNDEWMPHIAKLIHLKSLRFTNNGKLTDAGMVQLAGLKDLESFSFVGTTITGRAYAKFEGFTKLTRVSHRGSKIDDEGLKELCDHLPNLESLSLAHAKFTDAGAPNLAKLSKLKGLELGAHATPAALKNITALPIESLQLGEGFNKSESLPIIKEIKTLKRLTLINFNVTDGDLDLLATMTHLESLELGGFENPEAHLPQLAAFSFLKELKFYFPKRYSPETQAKIKALLPKVEVKFTPL